jgi:hypothetical protein
MFWTPERKPATPCSSYYFTRNCKTQASNVWKVYVQLFKTNCEGLHSLFYLGLFHSSTVT